MSESSQLHLILDDADAIDDLFRQALHEKGSDAFHEFLAFARRFSRYSAFNTMLIQAQRRYATAVGTRYQWKKIGRTINADAIPIIILRPFGPVEFVYEVGDTGGVLLPGQDDDPFAATGHANPLNWKRTVENAEKCSVQIEKVTYGSNLAGTATAVHKSEHGATLAGNGVYRWRIRINRALDEPSSFATLAHELGHIYCGHLGGDPRDRWPDRSRVLSHAQQEMEAEAVAYLVCGRAGLETRSAEYLSDLIVEDDLEHISAFNILNALNRIEARTIKAPENMMQTAHNPAQGVLSLSE